MPLSNPILGSDGMLIRQHMRSEDYVQGVSGWIIESNGSVEFNDAVFRGDIVANSFSTGVDPNARIEINVGTEGTIEFYPDGASADPATISAILAGNLHRISIVGPDIHPTSGVPGITVQTSTAALSTPLIGIASDRIQLNAINTIEIANDVIDGTDISVYSKNDIDVDADDGNITIRTLATDIFITAARNLSLRSNGGSGPQFQMNNNGNFNMANVQHLYVNGIGTSASAFNDLRRNSADGEIIMQTSSAAFKTNIEPMAPGWSDQLLNVELVTFDAIETTDYPDELKGITWAIPGTIAEEVATTFPDAVIHDGQGHPVGVSSDVLIAALIQKVQELCQWRDDVNRRG